MSLSKVQAINQLNNAVEVCRQAGLSLGVSRMYGETNEFVIMLANEFGYDGKMFHLNGHDNEPDHKRNHQRNIT
jgi:hypothetical protein